MSPFLWKIYNENQGNNDFKWLSSTFFAAFFPTILLFTRNKKTERIEWRNGNKKEKSTHRKFGNLFLWFSFWRGTQTHEFFQPSRLYSVTSRFEKLSLTESVLVREKSDNKLSGVWSRRRSTRCMVDVNRCVMEFSVVSLPTGEMCRIVWWKARKMLLLKYRVVNQSLFLKTVESKRKVMGKFVLNLLNFSWVMEGR